MLVYENDFQLSIVMKEAYERIIISKINQLHNNFHGYINAILIL